MRTCRVCGTDKTSASFYGASRECKVCHLERKRQEYAANPEIFKQRTSRYQAANPDRVVATRRKANGTPKAAARSRRYHLKKHGLTEREYDELFLAQGECCAICRQDQPGRFWCVDHDHECCDGDTSCGQCVRGILCWHCNVALGHFRDNPRSLQAAIDYLAGVRLAAQDTA